MALDFDFFSINPDLAKPKAGKVLISEPYLGDQYFKRSVVFLTEYSEKGAVGFVLNKPVSLNLSEMLNDFPKTENLVSVGGPVGTDTVHYIHTLGDIIPNSVKVFKSICWGGDFTAVKELLKSKAITPDKIRFFIGYSGWAPKQLDREISENSWICAEMDENDIMKNLNPDSWKNAVSRLGKKYKLWARFPENPDMN